MIVHVGFWLDSEWFESLDQFENILMCNMKKQCWSLRKDCYWWGFLKWNVIHKKINRMLPAGSMNVHCNKWDNKYEIFKDWCDIGTRGKVMGCQKSKYFSSLEHECAQKNAMQLFVFRVCRSFYYKLLCRSLRLWSAVNLYVRLCETN